MNDPCTRATRTRLSCLRPTAWLLAALLACAQAATAAVFYVDGAKGSDAATGSAREQAWKSITQAARAMKPGDTCVVLPGTYEERVAITRSGAEGTPIAFQGEGRPVCRGFAVSADYVDVSGFEVTGDKADGPGIGIIRGRHCRVSDNIIHHVPGPGISVYPHYTLPAGDPSVSDCLIEENRISYAVECGVKVGGQNHLIEGNEVSHTLTKLPHMTRVRDADGMRFFGRGHVFRGNYIHDILHQENLPADPHSDFFQTWSTAEEILFEGNLCTSRDTFGSNQIVMLETLSGKVHHLTFRNNVFVMTDPGYCPMNFCRKQGQAPIEDITIVNNAFVHLGKPGGEYAIWLNGVKGAVVKNNVFYNYGCGRPYAWQQGEVERIEIGNNLVCKPDGVAPAGGPHPGDLWMVDPRFADVAKHDFHPLPGSPLIDAGVRMDAVTQDYDGRPRPKGAGWDIGPFEGP